MADWIPFSERMPDAAELIKCSECKGMTHPRRIKDGICLDCIQEAEYRQHPARLFKKLGCPQRYRACTFGTWKGEKPKAVADWLDTQHDQRSDVLLWGPTGTGKTHLGTAMLFEHAIEDHYEPGRWRSARGYLEDLKHDFKADGNEVDRYVDTKSLMLDDLGAELLSGERGEWRRDRVGFVICERYDRKLPTIVTTNLGPEQIIAIDARIWSRLSAATVIHLSGKDRRVEPIT